MDRKPSDNGVTVAVDHGAYFVNSGRRKSDQHATFSFDRKTACLESRVFDETVESQGPATVAVCGGALGRGIEEYHDGNAALPVHTGRIEVVRAVGVRHMEISRTINQKLGSLAVAQGHRELLFQSRLDLAKASPYN